MKYRKLRIAFSAVCGVLCLLLIALWVRSYWQKDIIFRVGTPNTVGLLSWSGQILFIIDANNNGPPGWLIKQSRDVTHPSVIVDPAVNSSGFGWREVPKCLYVFVPHWFPVLLAAPLPAVPWLPWRFSLRTLLIATTLVAVVLGLIVATSR